MDLKNFSEAQLISIRDRLQTLHCGATDKVFIIADEAEANQYDSISIQDKRLSDLLFLLFCEAHNELCDRFTNKINLESVQPEAKP